MEFTVLDTDRGTALTGTPWPEYPRPSLRRDSFVNLNGGWDFAVGDPAQLPEQFDRMMEEKVRTDVVAKLKEYGFLYVTMDLSGYRMGSMNDGLKK